MPLIYAGIDEAGYGPMYGPLTVGCAALRLGHFAYGTRQAVENPPDLWQLLGKALCKTGKGAKGRILVNDSKKLKTAASGIKHLEPGVLGFLGGAGVLPTSWAQLRLALTPSGLSSACDLPWYAGDMGLPLENDPAALRIGASVLKTELDKAQVRLLGLRTAMLHEDRYNQMVSATGNKASVSFTLVAGHLCRLWESFAKEPTLVAIDRQGGRTHYRPLLAQIFPDSNMSILEETDARSVYHLEQGPRQMTVSFASGSEELHLPVALASMAAKYARELAMERFNAYFQEMAPQVKPTAGYGSDANRWRDEIMPHLKKARIDHARLRRIA